jgi:hypothetical protein
MTPLDFKEMAALIIAEHDYTMERPIYHLMLKIKALRMLYNAANSIPQGE